MSEICSKLKIKTPEICKMIYDVDVFIANLDQISHIFVMFPF